MSARHAFWSAAYLLYRAEVFRLAALASCSGSCRTLNDSFPQSSTAEMGREEPSDYISSRFDARIIVAGRERPQSAGRAYISIFLAGRLAIELNGRYSANKLMTARAQPGQKQTVDLAMQKVY